MSYIIIYWFRVRKAREEEEKDRAKQPPPMPIQNFANLNIDLGDESSEWEEDDSNDAQY